jgi:hypothetical protein
MVAFFIADAIADQDRLLRSGSTPQSKAAAFVWKTEL